MVVRMTTRTLPHEDLCCDVPDCTSAAVIHVGDEKRCYRHALERANEIRRAAGKPPIVVDEEGRAHVEQ